MKHAELKLEEKLSLRPKSWCYNKKKLIVFRQCREVANNAKTCAVSVVPQLLGYVIVARAYKICFIKWKYSPRETLEAARKDGTFFAFSTMLVS